VYLFIQGEIKPVLLPAGARFLQKGAAGKDLPRGCLGNRVQAGCRKQELLERPVEEATVPLNKAMEPMYFDA